MNKLIFVAGLISVCICGCNSNIVSTHSDYVESVAINIYEVISKDSGDIILETIDSTNIGASEVYLSLNFLFASEKSSFDSETALSKFEGLDTNQITSCKVFLIQGDDSTYKKDITNQLICNNPESRFFYHDTQLGYCSDVGFLKALYNDCAMGVADFYTSIFKFWVFKVDSPFVDQKNITSLSISVEIEFRNGRRLFANRRLMLFKR